MQKRLLFLIVLLGACSIHAAQILKSLENSLPAVIDSSSERIERYAVLAPFKASEWSIRHPERIAVVDAPKGAAAQLMLQCNNENGELDTSAAPYLFRKMPLTARLDYKLNLPPETFTTYNQLSMWVRPNCRQNRAALWLDVIGGFRGVTQVAAPLKGGQWTKIAICWSNLRPEDAQKIKTFSIGYTTPGSLPGDPAKTVIEIKDFRLEKIITGTECGWNVSPEKIVVPQTGYAPGETKYALLAATHPADDFTVKKGADIVLTGKLQTRNYPTGNFKIADFSSIFAPGTYTIASGNLVSVPFRIGSDNLKQAAKLSRQFMFSMRSGCATPAHPECLTDDARRSDTGAQVDVSGGWFDASDLCGFHAMAATAITRPMAFTAWHFDIPELYQEARWGGKLLNKLFEPETGLPYTVMCHFMVYRATKNVDMKNPDPVTKAILQGHYQWQIGKYYTDNRPGTGDERGIHFAKKDGVSSPHDRYDYHLGMSAACGWFALMASKQDSAMATSVAAKGLRHFKQIDKVNDDTLKSYGIIPFDRQFAKVRMLRLEALLASYLKNRDKEVRLQLSQAMRDLLSNQERRWFTSQDGKTGGTGWFNTFRNPGYDEPVAAAAILALYAETVATEDEYLDILLALRLYADGFLANPIFRYAPYNIPYLMTATKEIPQFGTPDILLKRGNITLYGIKRNRFASEISGPLALDALNLARFLRELPLENTARELLRFNLGENPSGRSLMTDVGSNFNVMGMSTVLGQIPGMLLNPQFENGQMMLPYNRNCARYEIYTQGQGAYTAALTVLDTPARITLLPACDASAENLLTKEKFNAVKGRLILPGGARYRIDANGISMEIPLLPADKLTIDLAKAPAFTDACLKQDAQGRILFSIKNRSTTVQTLKLACRASNMQIELPAPLTVEPGQRATVVLKNKILKTTEPAVLAVYPDGGYAQAVALSVFPTLPLRK